MGKKEERNQEFMVKLMALNMRLDVLSKEIIEIKRKIKPIKKEIISKKNDDELDRLYFELCPDI